MTTFLKPVSLMVVHMYVFLNVISGAGRKELLSAVWFISASLSQTLIICLYIFIGEKAAILFASKVKS